MDQKNKQTKPENAGVGRKDEQNEAINRGVQTGGPRWTDEQIDAITARNCNLLVAAAAGAGKTAVLVERIIRKIIDPTNPVDIDRMLIVTFTNAAATEMRERIGEAIAAELDKNPESEYIRRQMSLLGKASITTIHSFCRDVIKKNIQNIDLDPGFRVADDTECTLMRMETITELFEDQYEQEQDDFKALLESYGGNKNDQAIQDMVMSLYEFIQSSPWPNEWLDEQLQALDVQDGEDFARTPWGRVLTKSLQLEFTGLSQMMTQALDILKYATGLEKYIPVFQEELSGINQLAELTNAMINPSGSTTEMTKVIIDPSGSTTEMTKVIIDPTGSTTEMTKVIIDPTGSTGETNNTMINHSGSTEEMTKAMKHPSVCSNESWDRLYEALHSLEFKRLPRAGKDADKEKQKLVKELRDTVKDSIKKMKQKLVNAPSVEIIQDLRTLQPVMQCLANLVREFTRRYTEKKRNKAILDFNDLEHLCLQILSDPTGKGQCPSKAALAYRAYFDEIMVDEYQDSNMVQEIIIRMISRDRPDYPNVFMVGDVKQSIYRFRQAKPELFLEKYNTYSQEKGKAFRKILLYKNFRSRSSILDAVNFIFKQIMSVNAGELDYTDSEALNPGAEFDENDRADVTVGGPVEFHLIQTGGTLSEDTVNSSDMIENGGNPSGMVEKSGNSSIMREEGSILSNMMKMRGSPSEPDDIDLTDESNNPNDDEEEVPDNIQIEARLVALRILELMTPDAQGRTFQVYDKKKKTYRKVAFKDIVVLLRATKKWSDVFLEEFSKMGIPAFADTGTGFFKTIEIQIILSLLQIIDNPLQDIPLLAVLRSPMFAFTTNELAQLRLMNRKAMLFDCLKMLAQNDSADEGSPLAQERKADQGKLLAQEYVDDQEMPFRKEHRIGKNQFLKQEYLFGRNMPLEQTILADQNQLQAKDHSAVQDKSSFETASIKAANFLEKYACWRDKALHLSTDQLLWYLYQDTGYFGMVGAMPGGEQRQANLRILYDRARQFEETSYKGLFNFIHFIDRLKSSRGDMGSAKILGENDNVVRMMSIHKSKGLEFPVVFLSGCGKRFNLMDMNKSVLLHHQLGFGPDVVDSTLRLSRPSAPKLAIRERIRVETLSEEMRILYVALTRAREKLIITGSVRNVGKSVAKWLRVASVQDDKLPDMEMLKSAGYLDWIGPALIRHNTLQQEGNTLLDYASLGSDYSGRRITDSSCWQIRVWEKKDVLVEKVPEAHEERGFLEWLDSRRFSEPSDHFDEVKRRLEWHYAYGKVNKIPAKVTVTELKRRYESDLADVSRIPIHVPKLVKKPLFLAGEKGLTAAERGTVLHFVMQHLDLRNKDIQGQIDEMVQKDLLTRQQAQSVRIEKINRFVDSPLGQRMLKAKQVYREVPFHLEIPCHEVYLEMIEEAYRDETLLMQGMIDCYFEESDGLVLVDYKTDIIPPGGIEAIMGRYRVQLDYYARALAILTQKRVKESYLYLFSVGELLEM